MLLELRGDEPVLRIAGGVASLGKRGFVLGLPQVEFGDAPALGLAFPVHPLGLQCRLDGHRLDHSHYLRRDRGVHAGAAETETARQTEHEVRPVAAIGRAAGGRTV